MGRAPWRIRSVGGLVVLALGAGFGSPRYACAEPPPPDQTTWYGWETLASDGAAIALFAAAAALDDAKSSPGSSPTIADLSDVALAAGFAVYLLGPPLLHLGRGNGEKTATSAVLRLGLPLLGAVGGAALGRGACGPSRDADVSCPFKTAIIGFVGGGVAAMAIDATVLARKPAGPAAPTIQPMVVPVAGGASFILGGRF